MHALHVSLAKLRLKYSKWLCACASLAAESAAYWRGLQGQCPSNKMMWPCTSLDVGLNASGSTTQEAMARIQDACKV